MVDSTNLPNVDINQIATDLNGKMDRDGVNASCPTLLSRTANSNGGVTEIWSDGYCVQTGITGAINGNGEQITVTLSQSYKDTSYNCFVTINRKYDGGYRDQFLVACNITTTSFGIYSNWAGSYNGTKDNYAQWRTEGYIR